MPWVVYDTNRVIVGLYDTAAGATTQAALDADWTASGEIATIPADSDVGWYLTTADEVVPEIAATGVTGLQDAIRGTQLAFKTWLENLRIQAVGHSPDAEKKGHSFLYEGLRGLYIVSNDSTTYTLARRTSFAQLLAQGAADVTDVPTFYEVSDTLTAPAVPTVWVSLPDTADPARVNLANAVATGGTAPAASVDLLGDTWVAAITA